MRKHIKHILLIFGTKDIDPYNKDTKLSQKYMDFGTFFGMNLKDFAL